MLFAFVFGAAFSFSCFSKLFVCWFVCPRFVRRFVQIPKSFLFNLSTTTSSANVSGSLCNILDDSFSIDSTTGSDSRPENIIIIYRKKQKNSSIWYRIYVPNTKPLIISFSLFCLFYFFENYLCSSRKKIPFLTSSLWFIINFASAFGKNNLFDVWLAARISRTFTTFAVRLVNTKFRTKGLKARSCRCVFMKHVKALNVELSSSYIVSKMRLCFFLGVQ